jgi:hypothetical protein
MRPGEGAAPAVPARRAAGSYYTPPRLVESLLDTALEPVLEAALPQPDPEAALLALRVCDPACGSGHFLLAAAWRLARRLAARRTRSDQPPAAALRAALRDVVGRCLYGVDLDPLAVELCRVGLWLEAAEPGRPFRFPPQRIRQGNSLLGATPAVLRPGPPTRAAGDHWCRAVLGAGAGGPFFHWHLEFPEVFQLPKTGEPPDNPETGWSGGFDVVLGNPPFGAPGPAGERRLLVRTLPQTRRVANSAADFVALSRGLVRAGGRVGLVVPKSLTYSCDWRELRAWLLPGVHTVVDVSRAWDDVLLEQVLLTCTREPAPGPLQVGQDHGGTVRSRAAPRALVETLDVLPSGLTGRDAQVLGCLRRSCAGTLGALCRTGRGSGLQRYLRPGDDGLPALGGRDIRAFRPPCPARHVPADLPPGPQVRVARPPQAAFQNIVAHIRRPADHIALIGTVLRRPFACLDTVNLLSIRRDGLSPAALCGLLMSDLVNWFVYVCVYNRAVRTMHFDGYFLDKIPVPDLAHLGRLDPWALAVEAEPTSPAAWRGLNETVFDLYRIPSGWARAISARHKPRWLG